VGENLFYLKFGAKLTPSLLNTDFQSTSARSTSAVTVHLAKKVQL